MPDTFSRRQVLGAAAASFLAPLLARAAGQAPKHILLRSSWQTVNIGDIAHTPGLLRLLDEYLPETRVTLWPNKLDRGVAEMLRRNFPKLRILEPTKPEIAEAFEQCDFMLHGSGPSVVGYAQLVDWHAKTKKPFGIYGVTFATIDEPMRELLSAARFVFCRDTDSLAYLKEKSGVKGPAMDFAPDATFALHIRNDEAAKAYLQSVGLEPRKFLCAVPRLRYTPYANRPEEERKRRAAVSDQFKEADHAKMREAIVAVVRKSGLKVLCCPEMTYQLEIIQPLLIDPLPEDVKRNVVRRETYWLTDEAAGVYAQAHSVISMEMHSPIIAVANGTPAIHLRQPTDTRKGQMWRDIGLKEWLFEMDEAKGSEIADALVSIAADYPAALVKTRGAMDFVRKRHAETMGVLARVM